MSHKSKRVRRLPEPTSMEERRREIVEFFTVEEIVARLTPNERLQGLKLIVTRYPEDIDKLQKDFTQPIVKDILARSKVVLRWIKIQF